MQKNIILIGTESSGLSYIRMLLAREAYSVTLLRDPHRAEETIIAQRPSLIIIDDQADELPSMQFCHQLKNNPTIAGIKTVLLLPYANGAVIEAVREACGVNVLTKPVLPHLLLNLVASLMSANGEEKENEHA